MNLSPRETDKLLVFLAAQVAQRRRERGVKLNHTEAIALISDGVIEAARDGKSVAEAMHIGTTVLTADEVLDEVPDLVSLVQVEATFPDGTKLVSVHDPIRH